VLHGPGPEDRSDETSDVPGGGLLGETCPAPALPVSTTLTRLLLSGESRKTAEGRTLRQKY
jgi:hypothetical protein